MKSNEYETVHGFQPIMDDNNQIPGFNPLQLVRMTSNGPKLELPYKKLWFRKKYPNGKMRSFALKITDQLAIIEARVFSDRRDSEPISSYIAEIRKDDVSSGQYIQIAQELAADHALSDAGFDIQFVPPAGFKADPSQPLRHAKIASLPKAETPTISSRIDEVKPTAKTTDKPIVQNQTKETALPQTEQPIGVQQEKAVKTEPENKGEASIQLEDFIPLEEEETSPENPASPSFTSDMPVEKICSLMSLEEANQYVVKDGACKGWSLAQVADRRPASLKFYVNGYAGTDNILRAGAKLILDSRLKQAS